ncbi:N-acetylglucosamine kinase [Psychromicrobium xiongbiense]|uniref:N-acetylglucosamine kinase n=1 Tax=Psychromicrobium xiongbiense TaxID=3051184 RepID=UPI0025534735|nr:BadF/BadG/BcrA/BcrD ATPase family protein [Psychromicrobium sp. YIM S02556]
MKNSLQLLALDAGGTSTRAVLLDLSGHCLGYGRSGPGNPISSGIEKASASQLEAASQAIQASGQEKAEISTVTIAMAGGATVSVNKTLQQQFSHRNLGQNMVIESDLLATFFSGNHHRSGYAMVAGTGAVCARIVDYRIHQVVDGLGWLLGDEGSGFWIGQHVARAALASMDGRGAPTSLAELLLDKVAITAPVARIEGRPGQLQALITALYRLRPIDLATLAPLAFQAAAEGDDVARQILAEAGAALVHSLGALEGPSDRKGPGAGDTLVLGGSILGLGSPVATAVEQAVAGATVVRVEDGLAGAALLALRTAGVEVDLQVFERIANSLAALRGV